MSVHVTACPQLFVTWPQATPEHAVEGDSGVQHAPASARQISPLSQEAPQGTEIPHVRTLALQTVVPHAPASTVQHVPASPMQISEPGHDPHATSEPQLFVA